MAGVNPHAVASVVAGDPRIRLLGPVEDAVRTIAQSQIAIVPLLSGSGTRFKILEAWAAERAVVSTTMGAEGLGAVPDHHLKIANDPESFAGAILHLLANSTEREGLARSGRVLYLENYTWPAVWRGLESSGTI